MEDRARWCSDFDSGLGVDPKALLIEFKSGTI